MRFGTHVQRRGSHFDVNTFIINCKRNRKLHLNEQRERGNESNNSQNNVIFLGLRIVLNTNTSKHRQYYKTLHGKTDDFRSPDAMGSR